MDSQLKISRAITNLAFNNPFFGSCLMQLDVRENKAIPTLATNGTSLYWSDEFIQSIESEEEVRGGLAHEVMHVVLGHCKDLKGKDPRLANVAMDWLINRQLLDSGFKLPEGALLDPTRKTDGWAWEEVYKLLENVKEDKDDPFENTPNRGNGDRLSNSEKESIQSQIGSAQEHVQPQEGLSDAQKTELQNKIDDMIIKAVNAAESSGRGEVPGDVKRKVNDIRTPKLDWRELLRNIVVSNYPEDYSFRKPNRKYLHQELFMPTFDGATPGTIAIAVDTSGSVSEEELTAFIGEINSILNDLKPEKVLLMAADYNVANVQEFDGDVWFSPEDFDALGGGGTSFRPVFEYLENERIVPDQLVYFSDMQVYISDFPDEEPLYPVLFVSSTRATDAPFGEVIQLEV